VQCRSTSVGVKTVLSVGLPFVFNVPSGSLRKHECSAGATVANSNVGVPLAAAMPSYFRYSEPAAEAIPGAPRSIVARTDNIPTRRRIALLSMTVNGKSGSYPLTSRRHFGERALSTPGRTSCPGRESVEQRDDLDHSARVARRLRRNALRPSRGVRRRALSAKAPRETKSTESVQQKPQFAGFLSSGRYWARTSDLRLVEAALSQLS
jgi:hypothetical protein